MTTTLEAALAQIAKLPAPEQDTLAAILLEEIASEQRWSASFAKSGAVLQSLAAEAIAEFTAGKSRPLQDLL